MSQAGCGLTGRKWAGREREVGAGPRKGREGKRGLMAQKDRKAWAACTQRTPNVWTHDYGKWRARMRGFALGVAVLARRMSTSAQDGDSGGAAA
uniref:Uncharacterized protein n=1 Tax=Oryza nivara TaxID=4536 RepID=A0A0E0HQW9_ORYNI